MPIVQIHDASLGTREDGVIATVVLSDDNLWYLIRSSMYVIVSATNRTEVWTLSALI